MMARGIGWRRRSTGWKLGLLLVMTTGCVTRHRVDVDGETVRPMLRASTIAVLPVLSTGSVDASGTAIVGTRVLDAIFERETAGITFLGPALVLRHGSVDSSELAALRDAQATASPPPRESAERGRSVFHGRSVGGVPLERRIDIMLRKESQRHDVPIRSGMAMTFAAIPADYVLVSVALGRAREISRWLAFLGVLPFARTHDVQARGPRVSFALYEVRSGLLVWEATVGVLRWQSDDDPRHAREIVDARVLPFVVGASLLTEDFEGGLARALAAMPGASRRDDR